MARCDAADLPAARAMCTAGFELMDTLVYAEHSLSDPPPQSSSPAIVRTARPDDLPIIEAIARESFAGYHGHYHADPRLDRIKCDEAYVSWALRAAKGEAADETFIGEVDGEIAGFLSVRGGETGNAPIAGVTARARRRGVYRTLLEESVRWCAAAGSKRMIIHSQITSPTLTTWIRIGFRLYGADHTFHKWFDDAADRATAIRG